MVLKKDGFKISSQYLNKDRIITTVLNVITPAHFILKEAPSIDSSLEARCFAEAEESMQKYYESLESCFLYQMPLKDSIIIVLFELKYCRARVVSILSMSNRYLFKVYLLDYGKECDVPRSSIYEIHKDFLKHPFQAVHFKLMGIEPMSYMMSNVDLSMMYRPVTEWDISSETFLKSLQKGMCSSYIEIKTNDDQCLYGNLYLVFGDSSVKCVNEELLANKFAFYNENCLKKAGKLQDASSVVTEKTVTPESTTPNVLNSNITQPSPNVDSEFKAFTVSLVRPSDGKVVAESSVTNSTPTLLEENVEISTTPTHYDPKVKSTAISTTPTPSVSKVDEKNTDVTSNPVVVIQQKIIQKEQISCKFSRLQKLLTYQQNHVQSPNEEKLPIDICSPLESNSNSIVKSPSETRPQISNLDSSLTPSTSKTSVPMVSNAVNVSPTGEIPKQENLTPPSENLKMFQKLQKLQQQKTSPTSATSLKKDEDGNTPVSKTISKTISSPTLQNPCTPTPEALKKEDSNLVKTSPHPKKGSVNFQKVKALYQRTSPQSPTSISTEFANNVPNDKTDSLEPQCPTKSSPSDKMNASSCSIESKSSVSLPPYCSETADFVCSSPKSVQKISLTPAGSESTMNNNNARPIIKKRSSFSEASDRSFSDNDPVLNNSHMLKRISDLSDSDDILYTLTKKENESFSNNSDIDISHIDYATLEHTNSHHSINFSDNLSLWEKQNVPALQIGKAIPRPVLTTEEAEFSPYLQKVLKIMNFFGPSCIQSVVWPSMARRRNLIAIAPPHSGKTVAFMLPIVSAFTDDDMPISKGTGPIAIILCSSWKKAQAVYDLFNKFLGDTKLRIVTLCADGGDMKQKVQSLINGCELFITTPFCMLQCLKKKLVNFSRCNHFILDDGSTIMAQQKKELRDIFLHLKNGITSLPQIVVCAERWNKNFKIIQDKLMLMPLIFSTSFLESAICAKISIICHVCEESGKNNVLLKTVKDAAKVVICTADKHTATEIKKFLRYEDVRSYLVTEAMEHYNADAVIKDWKSAQLTTAAHALIITDQALIEMCISSADCLVHYDVPSKSRLQFGNRFSCIAENFQDEDRSKKCVCHVFMTEDDANCAPYLVEIIENTGRKAPPELNELCKKKKMKGNTSGPLCHYLKVFGFCKEVHCEFRHVIDPILDKPQVVPFEGDVQALVTHVLDASHYYIRLLKYLDPVSKKTVSFGASYAEVPFKLKDFYCNASEEMEIVSPEIGRSYVLVKDNALYYRIKVLEKVEASLSRLLKWKVLFLDEGWIKYYEKLKIYKLSDEIELPKPLAVEAYVCNLVTPDSCFDWNPRTTLLVSDLIKGKEINGKIVLCLGETLWLDPIVLRTHLSSLNDYVNQLKLDNRLIEFGHARENKNHLTLLQKACLDKVSLPRIINSSVQKVEKDTEVQSPVSYAFLDGDINEKVYVSSVLSPHHFYVQRAKFVDCLEKLLDDINNKIENKTLKRNFTFCKDMHCVAPFHEDGRYYRAVITDVFPDDIQLFYVDYGDTGTASKSDIYCLPAEYLLLPFQAIECELSGIAPAHGGWSEAASDFLYNLTRDEAGDMKILELKVYSKTISFTGGNHYIVDLWCNQKRASLQLLETGFGVSIEVPMTVSSDLDQQDGISGKVDNEIFNFSDEENLSDENEDKDAAALFCCVLSRMTVEGNNGNPATITEVSSKDDVATNQSRDIYRLIKQSEVILNAAAKEQDESVKPLITWWNTPEQLSILINLKNMKVHNLVVTDEGLKFNAFVAGIQYATEEKFFAKIQSKDASIYQNHQGLNVVAKKVASFKWPRLVETKEKFLHIKYDLIHIDDSDSEDLSGDVNSNYREDLERAGYKLDDNEDSTDEEEKYVEPWKKVAQYRDPYNMFQ